MGVLTDSLLNVLIRIPSSFRPLSRGLGCLTLYYIQREEAEQVSVPSRGDWGFLQVVTEREKYDLNFVSVPSRGDWGFLPILSDPKVNGVMFPSPPEVTGGSYPISCIGPSRRTTRYSLTSQLKLILIIP